MNDRERLLKEVLDVNSKSLILELVTGVGKTFLALKKIEQINPDSILIVIPRLVLINNWKEEIKKWGLDYLLPRITFTTYVSLHKHLDKYYSLLCLDEAHRLSPTNREYFNLIKTDYTIFLSATLPREHINYFKHYFNSCHIKYRLEEAIDSNTLPEPIFHKVSLNIYNIKGVFSYIKGKGKPTRTCTYQRRFDCFRSRETVSIECKAFEYLTILNEEIAYYKRQTERTNNVIFRNKWLYLSNQRLKFLASLKTDYIKHLIQSLPKEDRTIIFASSIEQAKEFTSNAITSDNTEAKLVLDKFNNKEINLISSVNMLNEGVNLTSCNKAIYAMINSSDIIQYQRIGRSLRHSKPEIYLIYFRDTREEEIVNKMLESINRNE